MSKKYKIGNMIDLVDTENYGQYIIFDIDYDSELEEIIYLCRDMLLINSGPEEHWVAESNIHLISSEVY